MIPSADRCLCTAGFRRERRTGLFSVFLVATAGRRNLDTKVMEQKWRIIRSERLLKDRWIDLRADHCVTPAGKQVSPYYVLSYPDWVHIVAVTPDHSIVLVQQYRHAIGRHFLELPAGAVDPADTVIEDAARRELEEETGYRAASWRLVSSLYPNPAIQTNQVHTFLALDAICDRPQRLDDGEEGLRVTTMPVSEVLDGLRSGLLELALHVSSVLLALPERS